MATKGDLVKVGYWIGRVEDVLISDGRRLYQIASPKGVWRNFRSASEWVEEIPSLPFQPVTEEEFEHEVERYVHRIEDQLVTMEAMFNGNGREVC